MSTGHRRVPGLEVVRRFKHEVPHVADGQLGDGERVLRAAGHPLGQRDGLVQVRTQEGHAGRSVPAASRPGDKKAAGQQRVAVPVDQLDRLAEPSYRSRELTRRRAASAVRRRRSTWSWTSSSSRPRDHSRRPGPAPATPLRGRRCGRRSAATSVHAKASLGRSACSQCTAMSAASCALPSSRPTRVAAYAAWTELAFAVRSPGSARHGAADAGTRRDPLRASGRRPERRRPRLRRGRRRTTRAPSSPDAGR